jgi:ABC-2 type transport system ATP-binding protein
MVAGELLVEGTPSEIKARQRGHLLEFSVDQPQRAADLLKSETQHWRVALFGKRLHIITDSDVDTGISENTQRLEAGGVHVLGAREGRFSLEDVFISIVEQARERGKISAEE